MPVSPGKISLLFSGYISLSRSPGGQSGFLFFYLVRIHRPGKIPLPILITFRIAVLSITSLILFYRRIIKKFSNHIKNVSWGDWAW